MSAFFISYSRTDTETAVWFANQLREAGLPVWFDQVDIKPSDRWDRTIEAALHDCQGLVLILSPRSASSENVLDEITVAMDARKPIIPVMIETCQPPLRLARVQWIDARSDKAQALQRCRESLQVAMGHAPAAFPETPRAAFQLSAQQADILAQCLTVFIGPMARHVVEHEGRASSGMDDLVERLAARLQTTGDRDLFLRAVRGG